MGNYVLVTHPLQNSLVSGMLFTEIDPFVQWGSGFGGTWYKTEEPNTKLKLCWSLRQIWGASKLEHMQQFTRQPRIVFS